MSDIKVNLDPQAQAVLAQLAVDLANNPETRKDFARIAKKVDPKRRFPDVEADEAKELIASEFEKRDQAEAMQKATRKAERARAKVAEKYDDESMKEIESLMEKHGIADYEVAAKLYSADAKPATPTPQAGDYKFTMPNIEVKDFGNLKQIQRDRAYQAIDDIARQRVK